VKAIARTPERRKAHDHANDGEERAGRSLDQPHEMMRARTQTQQSQAEQHGKAAPAAPPLANTHDGVGNDVQEEVDRAQVLRSRV
jgi:hypothetical protein